MDWPGKVSLGNGLFEDLGDVFEVVVAESDVNHMLLQLSALVHRLQQVTDLCLQLGLSDLALLVVVLQLIVLLT